jgi:hypothetical protein
MLIFAAFLVSAGMAAAEEIRTGDSIAPMKMEIEMGTDSETITKTIYVKNTGNTPIQYVFYTDQAGGKSEISSKFKLSETETEILPGNTFELNLTISKKDLEKYDSKDLENVKIKMIRNPESQTPVGYIIPVEINNFNEKGKEKEETSKSKTNSNIAAGGIIGISEKISAALNDMKNEKNGTESKDENTEKSEAESEKKEYENNQISNRTIKTVIAIGMLSIFSVLISGLYLNRKRKTK